MDQNPIYIQSYEQKMVNKPPALMDWHGLQPYQKNLSEAGKRAKSLYI